MQQDSKRPCSVPLEEGKIKTSLLLGRSIIVFTYVAATFLAVLMCVFHMPHAWYISLVRIFNEMIANDNMTWGTVLIVYGYCFLVPMGSKWILLNEVNLGFCGLLIACPLLPLVGSMALGFDSFVAIFMVSSHQVGSFLRSVLILVLPIVGNVVIFPETEVWCAKFQELSRGFNLSHYG